ETFAGTSPTVRVCCPCSTTWGPSRLHDRQPGRDHRCAPQLYYGKVGSAWFGRCSDVEGRISLGAFQLCTSDGCRVLAPPSPAALAGLVPVREQGAGFLR